MKSLPLPTRRIDAGLEANDVDLRDSRASPDVQPVYARHVPDRIVCPRCNSKGLVRHENVIKGDKVERHYYCGACNYSWRVTYDGEKAERPPQPKRDRSE